MTAVSPLAESQPPPPSRSTRTSVRAAALRVAATTVAREADEAAALVHDLDALFDAASISLRRTTTVREGTFEEISAVRLKLTGKLLTLHDGMRAIERAADDSGGLEEALYARVTAETNHEFVAEQRLRLLHDVHDRGELTFEATKKAYRQIAAGMRAFADDMARVR